MKKKNINIDIIKVVAAFLVVLVHFYLKNGFYDLDYHSKIMKISLVIRNFGMVCVPLFIMTTGFLLRDKEYSKKYFKGVLKVYLIAVSIIILSAMYDSIFKYTPENVNISMPKLIVKSIISFGYSAWYIYIYVGLALMAPILRKSI